MNAASLKTYWDEHRQPLLSRLQLLLSHLPSNHNPLIALLPTYFSKPKSPSIGEPPQEPHLLKTMLDIFGISAKEHWKEEAYQNSNTKVFGVLRDTFEAMLKDGVVKHLHMDEDNMMYVNKAPLK